MTAPRRLYLSPARPTSKIGCTSWARVKTNTIGQIGATLCPPTPLAIVASTKLSGSKVLVMVQAIRALIRTFLVAMKVVCTFPKLRLQTPARLPATSCDTKWATKTTAAWKLPSRHSSRGKLLIAMPSQTQAHVAHRTHMTSLVKMAKDSCHSGRQSHQSVAHPLTDALRRHQTLQAATLTSAIYRVALWSSALARVSSRSKWPTQEIGASLSPLTRS